MMFAWFGERQQNIGFSFVKKWTDGLLSVKMG
jgi:hypothetical protein